MPFLLLYAWCRWHRIMHFYINIWIMNECCWAIRRIYYISFLFFLSFLCVLFNVERYLRFTTKNEPVLKRLSKSTSGKMWKKRFIAFLKKSLINEVDLMRILKKEKEPRQNAVSKNDDFVSSCSWFIWNGIRERGKLKSKKIDNVSAVKSKATLNYTFT